MTGVSINRKILNLALPAVLYTITKSSFSIIDMYWVGKLGSVELAGLTVATFITWGVISLAEVISVGINTLVAQAVGAEDRFLSRKVSTVNLVNSFFYSVLFSLYPKWLLHIRIHVQRFQTQNNPRRQR